MASLRFTAVIISLALSVSVHAWPQIPSESRFFGEEIRSDDIVSNPSSRSLPVVGERISAGTLPIPSLANRDVLESSTTENNDNSLPDSLQEDEKRELPEGPISPGLLTLPIVHVERPVLQKRGVEIRLENRSDLAYYAQLNIGNPVQKVLAQLDTGSFELWINPSCQELDPGDKQFCEAVGNYDPSKSSSSQVSNLTASLRYGIGSAEITYVLDDIALVNAPAMKRVQFGVAQSSKDQFAGILGIGHGIGINTGYKNFVDQLADQGITKTKAYSVALGSKTDKAGVVVFGGVDSGKFTGKLAPLPIIPGKNSPDGVARFWVTLNSIQHTPDNGKTTDLSTTSMPVFLDTGATLTLLPPQLANRIAQAVGAGKPNEDGFYLVSCDLASKNGTLDFNFNGVAIKVPYKEIVREISGSPPSCYLGIMPSTSFALLGDTFLRSAYVVFDISKNMTYMAPYANCGTNTQTIDASTDVASIVGTCSKQVGNETSGPDGSPAATPGGGNTGGGNTGNKQKENGGESLGVAWNWYGVLAAFAMGALAV